MAGYGSDLSVMKNVARRKFVYLYRMNQDQAVYLLLGGNLGDCVRTFRAARREISRRVGKITKASVLFTSPAWGFEAKEDFYNQAVEVRTELDPYALLRIVLDIERELGRVRTSDPGYASRTLDIDILFYGDTCIHSPSLSIPHPLLPQRAFALLPLSRIAPEMVHPQLKLTVAQLLAQCPDAVENVRPCALSPEEMYAETAVMESSDNQFKQEEPQAGVFPENIRFIAIEGNIGAGKTSLSRRIARQFGAKLVTESFEENEFLPKFYRNRERYAFPLELTFLAERYRQAKEDFVQELFSPFIVSDFSICKSLIFAQNTLQEDEYSLFSRLYRIILTTVPQPDLYVYIHSDIDRLIRNIRCRGRHYESDMDPDYLRQIERGYLNYMNTLHPDKSLVIPVSDLDFVNNQADYDLVLDKIIRAAHKAMQL